MLIFYLVKTQTMLSKKSLNRPSSWWNWTFIYVFKLNDIVIMIPLSRPSLRGWQSSNGGAIESCFRSRENSCHCHTFISSRLSSWLIFSSLSSSSFSVSYFQRKPCKSPLDYIHQHHHHKYFHKTNSRRYSVKCQMLIFYTAFLSLQDLTHFIVLFSFSGGGL